MQTDPGRVRRGLVNTDMILGALYTAKSSRAVDRYHHRPTDVQLDCISCEHVAVFGIDCIS